MTQHQHEWTDTDQPGIYACAECPATAHTCTNPIPASRDTKPCGRLIEGPGHTCHDCVSRHRNDLREIRDLYRRLPDVIAAAAGLHAIRYDQRGTTRSATDTTIIGGAAMVLAGGGATYTHLGRGETTDAIATLLEAERHDPPSVLAVLTQWEDAWRIEQRQHAAETTSIDAALGYLVVHTEWAAQHSPTWDQHRADMRTLRGRLRAVTGESQPPVKTGVPCPYCAGTVQQHWTTEGLGDTRRCDGCGITWATEAHFALAIRDAHESLPESHPDQLVTLDDARRILKPRGVRPNLLALWLHRDVRDRERYDAEVAAGRLATPPTPRLPESRGRDVRGRLLYRLGDLVDRTCSTGEAATA